MYYFLNLHLFWTQAHRLKTISKLPMSLDIFWWYDAVCFADQAVILFIYICINFGNIFDIPITCQKASYTGNRVINTEDMVIMFIVLKGDLVSYWTWFLNFPLKYYFSILSYSSSPLTMFICHLLMLNFSSIPKKHFLAMRKIPHPGLS